MIRPFGIRVGLRLACLVMTSALLCGNVLHAQDEDGGISHDSRGNILLESIYVPELPNAPFSLMLSAEWTRPLMTGGTFTIVNARPIRRDSAGRIYQERWLMVPKNTGVKSTLSVIQIEDPLAGVFYQCWPRQKFCEVNDLGTQSAPAFDPSRVKSGKLRSGRGYVTHEDKGIDTVAGIPVHAYRDTTVVDAGAMGNDSPMTYVRDIRYSSQLGFNLTSILQAPAVGEQRFAVTEITTTEPDPQFFRPPEGYRMVDKRQAR